MYKMGLYLKKGHRKNISGWQS